MTATTFCTSTRLARMSVAKGNGQLHEIPLILRVCMLPELNLVLVCTECADMYVFFWGGGWRGRQYCTVCRSVFVMDVYSPAYLIEFEFVSPTKACWCMVCTNGFGANIVLRTDYSSDAFGDHEQSMTLWNEGMPQVFSPQGRA